MVNSVEPLRDNIVCVKCRKNCGWYLPKDPMTNAEMARYGGSTQFFICKSCLRRQITCPSCGQRPLSNKYDSSQSTAKKYVFDCECGCGRLFDANVMVEFLSSVDDLNITKKVKKKKE